MSILPLISISDSPKRPEPEQLGIGSCIPLIKLLISNCKCLKISQTPQS